MKYRMLLSIFAVLTVLCGWITQSHAKESKVAKVLVTLPPNPLNLPIFNWRSEVKSADALGFCKYITRNKEYYSAAVISESIFVFFPPLAAYSDTKIPPGTKAAGVSGQLYGPSLNCLLHPLFGLIDKPVHGALVLKWTPMN